VSTPTKSSATNLKGNVNGPSNKQAEHLDSRILGPHLETMMPARYEVEWSYKFTAAGVWPQFRTMNAAIRYVLKNVKARLKSGYGEDLEAIYIHEIQHERLDAAGERS
jgi:hypothetical protein